MVEGMGFALGCTKPLLLSAPPKGTACALKGDEKFAAHRSGHAAEEAEFTFGVSGFDFWRLPLQELVEEAEETSKRVEPLRADSVFSSTVFWRLPLPELIDEPKASDPSPRTQPPQQQVPSSPPRPRSATPAPASGFEGTGACEDGEGAGLERGDATEGVLCRRATFGDVQMTEYAKADRPRWPKRNLADEMQDMLDEYQAERAAFQKNLEELVEMQERLRALTLTSSLQHAASRQKIGKESSSSSAELQGAFRMPPEIVGRTFWHLDFSSLARAMHACHEWTRLARNKVRWQWLCEADWGLQHEGSWHEYRNRLGRWRVLQSTLASLKGSGCPSGICGSFARRRLFEALEALVELGAQDPDARYPSQVHALLRSTEASRTLLALLEDESPHLLCLAVRCLADLVSRDDAERSALRTELVQRGALIRRLLEGEDVDVVESAARLMLNLHGGAPGTPLSTRRRGPAAFAEERACSAAGRATAVAAAAAWTGVWAGEMRYARGGERHAALRLVLGAAGDPAVAQAVAAMRAAGDADGGGPGGPGSGSSGAGSSSGAPLMRAEGKAEYWHYFGFLADSDFDCAHETLKYVDEQIRRQREVSSSQQHRPRRQEVSLLVGAGWDEQNGAFVAEAPLPYAVERAPSSPNGSAGGVSVAMTNAVPLRLSLRYESRGTYELTGFLAEGAGEPGGRARAPVLYGVWATAPSQHKHLFALRLLAPLPDPE